MLHKNTTFFYNERTISEIPLYLHVLYVWFVWSFWQNLIPFSSLCQHESGSERETWLWVLPICQGQIGRPDYEFCLYVRVRLGDLNMSSAHTIQYSNFCQWCCSICADVSHRKK